MRVLLEANYTIYVYSEDHAPPHCHVRYTDNGMESLVDLYLLEVMEGRPITKRIRTNLLSNQELLINIWEQLNPTRQDTNKSKKSTKE